MTDMEKGPLPLARLSNEEQDTRKESSNEISNKDNSRISARSWLTKSIGDIYAEDNPMNLSKSKKNAIILVVALGGIFGPLASMIYMPSLVQIATALNTSITSINATVSTYVVFMGIAVSGTRGLGNLCYFNRLQLIHCHTGIIALVLGQFK
jgi:hypothetical protein